MQGSEEEVEQAYFVNQRKPWQQQCTQGMISDPASSFNSWNNMYNQGLPQYPMQYSMPNLPPTPWQNAMPNQYPTPWMPWGPNPQQPNVPNPWNQNWRNPPFQGSKLPVTPQQQQLLLPNNLPPNQPLRPQLPIQNTPNPNNKPVQQVETTNLLTNCIFPVQCNDVHLQSGRVVQTEK